MHCGRVLWRLLRKHGKMSHLGLARPFVSSLHNLLETFGKEARASSAAELGGAGFWLFTEEHLLGFPGAELDLSCFRLLKERKLWAADVDPFFLDPLALATE